MKVDKFKYSNQWSQWIGKSVEKHSDKPFKSGLKVGRVMELTINPHSGKDGFLMDDGSIVDCHQVKLTSSIPKEQWGVHETHCCEVHGCKYSKVDCPVKIGLIAARHECEYCVDDASDEHPQYSPKVAKELSKLGQRYLFDIMLQMTKLDEEDKLKFLVDKNKDLSLSNTINKHSMLRTPEEKQHIIELGERFTLEVDSQKWWGNMSLSEKKAKYDCYKAVLFPSKEYYDLTSDDIVNIYEFNYGD